MSLVIAGSLLACTDDTTFTSEERDLLAIYKLPAAPPKDASNRVADDPRAAILGKKFFFDPRFSGALGVANDGVTNGSLGAAGTTGKVSCYGCHQIEQGGTDHRSRPLATSLGVNYGLRNAPSVINAAFSDIDHGGWQLWDGRKDNLWAVALGPLECANEHAGTRLAYAHLIFDKYKDDYEAIFGALPDLTDLNRFPAAGKPGDKAGFDGMAAPDKLAINTIYANLGKSIEAFERRLTSPSFEKSPFDKMMDALDRDDIDGEAGVAKVMDPAAIRGAKLFVGKAACNECHRGAMFTDYKFHNIGCPQTGINVPTIDIGRSGGFAKLQADIFNRGGAFSDQVPDGYADMIKNLAPVDHDLGSFRTPSLRNIEKTAPYMHDGVYVTLWDVVSHYNFGGGTGTFSGTKESAVSPLLLSNDEMDDLVAFLRSLSDGPPLATSDFPEGLLAAPPLPQ